MPPLQYRGGITIFRSPPCTNPSTTLDAYMSSPWVVDPLRRDDCALVSDRGAAIVVMSARRARDLRVPLPVPVLGFGHGQTSFDLPQRATLTSTEAVRASQTAFAMAGVRPQDVDVAQLCDCFTVTVLMTLEDYGTLGRARLHAASPDGRRSDGTCAGGRCPGGHCPDPQGRRGIRAARGTARHRRASRRVSRRRRLRRPSPPPRRRMAARAPRRGRRPGQLAVVDPMGDLPYARQEGDAITALFEPSRSVRLAGDEATLDAVIAACAGKSFIHFGCHGFYDRDGEPLPQALADEQQWLRRLTAAEIARRFADEEEYLFSSGSYSRKRLRSSRGSPHCPSTAGRSNIPTIGQHLLRVVGHLPAHAARRSICTGLRAGVGQASREETAAHAAVVVEGCVAMAIGAVRPW